jgi:hypothetical protein
MPVVVANAAEVPVSLQLAWGAARSTITSSRML